MIKQIISMVMICIFTMGTIATSVNAGIINYENRPGSMIVKLDTDRGAVLAVLNSGKIKLTKKGAEFFTVNSDTVGKVYLINKADGSVKFVITSTYYKKHRATLHMLNDSKGYLVNVSVTLKAYNGYIHNLDVVEFINDIAKNLKIKIAESKENLKEAILNNAKAISNNIAANVDAAKAAATQSAKEAAIVSGEVADAAQAAQEAAVAELQRTVTSYIVTVAYFTKVEASVIAAEYSQFEKDLRAAALKVANTSIPLNSNIATGPNAGTTIIANYSNVSNTVLGNSAVHADEDGSVAQFITTGTTVGHPGTLLNEDGTLHVAAVAAVAAVAQVGTAAVDASVASSRVFGVYVNAFTNDVITEQLNGTYTAGLAVYSAQDIANWLISGAVTETTAPVAEVFDYAAAIEQIGTAAQAEVAAVAAVAQVGTAQVLGVYQVTGGSVEILTEQLNGTYTSNINFGIYTSADIAHHLSVGNLTETVTPVAASSDYAAAIDAVDAIAAVAESSDFVAGTPEVGTPAVAQSSDYAAAVEAVEYVAANGTIANVILANGQTIPVPATLTGTVNGVVGITYDYNTDGYNALLPGYLKQVTAETTVVANIATNAAGTLRVFGVYNKNGVIYTEQENGDYHNPDGNVVQTAFVLSGNEITAPVAADATNTAFARVFGVYNKNGVIYTEQENGDYHNPDGNVVQTAFVLSGNEITAPVAEATSYNDVINGAVGNALNATDLAVDSANAIAAALDGVAAEAGKIAIKAAVEEAVRLSAMGAAKAAIDRAVNGAVIDAVLGFSAYEVFARGTGLAEYTFEDAKHYAASNGSVQDINGDRVNDEGNTNGGTAADLNNPVN